MSARALARAGLPPVPQIDLEALPHPQYVNASGIEVDEEIVEAEILPGENEEGAQEVVQVQEDVEMAAPEVQGEPLLDLADSGILPFTLIQTRQRHLTGLLPHIFSHPPIPSHSKPKAKPIPKGTFLFPTPPPPTLPLPMKEYHAATRGPGDASTVGDGEPAVTKGKKARGEAPSHEIDCIARVTLTIGPVSFPGTELWIGRFVEPRGGSTKVSRKKDQSERVERKKKAPAVTGVVRKASTSTARPSVLAQPSSGTPAKGTPISRPGGSSAGPTTGPTAGPSRKPGGPPPKPGGPAPARLPLDPNLIKRVNAAATQHPWLSTIIHKAARNNASKDELAKLGRVVARLGRGEDVGEGPLDGLEPPSSDLSDEEVDMKGPEQVGGGPLPEEAPAPAEAGGTSPADAPVAAPAAKDDPAKETAAPAPPVTAPVVTASATLAPTAPTPAVKAVSGAGPTATPTPAVASGTPAPLAPTSASAAGTPGPTAGPSNPSPAPTPTPGPPPVRRIYPLPPPFLLVAFKETPTEKYLLPLGSQSFVSRVGWEAPKPPPKAPTPPPQPAPTASVAPTDPAPVPTPAGPAGRGRGRTRQSLGRGAKEHAEVKPEPAPGPAKQTPVETPAVAEPVTQPPKPLEPPIPGAHPTDGTVLLSTLVPVGEWRKPDWPKLERRMPFYSKDYDEKPPEAAPSGHPQTPSRAQAGKKEPVSPLQRPRHGPVPYTGPKLDPNTLLNLAAEDWLPSEGILQAVTIRIEGLDEAAWNKMRWVIDHVESAEMKALSVVKTDLLETLPAPLPPAPGAPFIPKPFDPNLHPRLKEAYADFRKQHFEYLLQRKAPRSFPRLRVPLARADIKEAMTDKWGPRPYPMSTRPLYLTSPPPDAEYDYDQVEPQPKRKRGQVEEDVMFEMPVSLDMLDQHVEQGAKKSVNRRVGKLKMEKPGKKRHGKRYIMGTTCEGCASNTLRVWRMGPNGARTLCNTCGDKFAEGTLGELKAPGAASGGLEEGAEGEGEDGAEGTETEGGAGAVEVQVKHEEGGPLATPTADSGVQGEASTATATADETAITATSGAVAGAQGSGGDPADGKAQPDEPMEVDTEPSMAGAEAAVQDGPAEAAADQTAPAETAVQE